MHARILHICMRYVDHYMACKPARTKLPQSCMIDPIGPCHRAGHATDSEYAMGRGPKPPSALKADAIRPVPDGCRAWFWVCLGHAVAPIAIGARSTPVCTTQTSTCGAVWVAGTSDSEHTSVRKGE